MTADIGKNSTSILFLGKKNDKHCLEALEFVNRNFSNVSSCLGEWGDPMPEDIRHWDGDYIISYLSRWVVPASLLKKSRIAAINFHPASPDYPGIGCNNFALYDGADYFGVTCHHMSPSVDTGNIIATKKFPIASTDNVETLLHKTYDFQFALFHEIVEFIIKNEPLPESDEKWTRSPYTRKEFDQLFVIEPGMPVSEIRKRIRAVSYGEYQPFIEMGGFKFKLSER